MHPLIDQSWRTITSRSVLIGTEQNQLDAFNTRLTAALSSPVSNAPRPIVALKMSNDWYAVATMVALLRAGANPYIFANDVPNSERIRALKAVNGNDLYMLENNQLQRLDSSTKTTGPGICDPGLLLSTSGSTGTPKAVFRSLESWQWEARRYQNLFALNGDEHVLIAAPLAHAYALGWLWPALLHAGRLELIAPSALGAVTQAISTRATHVALTPTLASLLARRPRGADAAVSSKLRVVMAGAGPVDEALERNFENRFSIKLSRNYGSTETGAVLAGLAPQPTNTIGPPMPGISCMLEGDANNHTDTLVVRLEDGSCHNMGDIATCDEQGRYTIVGRKSEGLRRGERWVSPSEIADVIIQSGLVDDVHVRGTRSNQKGNDRLIASVVAKDGGVLDHEGLSRYCCTHLAAYKVPDLFESVREIPRQANGKVFRKHHYRRTADARLAAAARAYKISSMLFALSDSGMLAMLDGSSSTDDVAMHCGLRPKAVEDCLKIAELCGLVEQVDPSHVTVNQARTNFSATAFIDLERQLFAGLSSPAALLDALKTGLDRRAFEEGEYLNDSFRCAYADAMQGPHKAFFRRLALRKLPKLKAANILEIGASRGAYIGALLNENEESRGIFVRVGQLCPPEDASLSPHKVSGRLTCLSNGGDESKSLLQLLENTQFDTIIIDNAVHVPPPVGNIEALLGSLRPNGALLIDDIFLPTGGDAAIGIDWLTHGGTAFLTECALHEHLRLAGLHIHPITPIEPHSIHSVFLATRTTEP